MNSRLKYRGLAALSFRLLNIFSKITDIHIKRGFEFMIFNKIYVLVSNRVLKEKKKSTLKVIC